MTSIICLFELVPLNGLLFDEWVDHDVKKLNVEEALKLSIFVLQKAAAPKNVVEFRHSSIGTIRSILATPYDVWRPRATSYNVGRLLLMGPIEPWQNSTPFFGAAAFCTTKLTILGPLRC